MSSIYGDKYPVTVHETRNQVDLQAKLPVDMDDLRENIESLRVLFFDRATIFQVFAIDPDTGERIDLSIAENPNPSSEAAGNTYTHRPVGTGSDAPSKTSPFDFSAFDLVDDEEEGERVLSPDSIRESLKAIRAMIDSEGEDDGSQFDRLAFGSQE